MVVAFVVACLLLGRSVIAEQCFDSSVSVITEENYVNLRDGCDIIPRVNITALNETGLEGLVSLKNIAKVEGDFRIYDEPGIETLHAPALNIIAPRSEFSLQFLPELRTFNVSPEGIDGFNLDVIIDTTQLDRVPPFTTNRLNSLVLRNNTRMDNITLDNLVFVEAFGATRMPENATVSFPKLRTHGAGSMFLFDIQNFSAPNLTTVLGNVRVQNTGIEEFDMPDLHIQGDIMFRFNKNLTTLRVKAFNSTFMNRTRSISLVDNPLLTRINLTEMFPFPELNDTQKQEVTMFGDFEVAGQVDSIDTTGWRFDNSSSISIRVKSDEFDCDEFVKSIAYNGTVLDCFAEPLTVPTDSSDIGIASATGVFDDVPVSAAGADSSSSSAKTRTIVIAVLVPICSIALIATAVIVIMQLRRVRSNKENKGPGPGPTGVKDVRANPAVAKRELGKGGRGGGGGGGATAAIAAAAVAAKTQEKKRRDYEREREREPRGFPPTFLHVVNGDAEKQSQSSRSSTPENMIAANNSTTRLRVTNDGTAGGVANRTSARTSVNRASVAASSVYSGVTDYPRSNYSVKSERHPRESRWIQRRDAATIAASYKEDDSSSISSGAYSPTRDAIFHTSALSPSSTHVSPTSPTGRSAGHLSVNDVRRASAHSNGDRSTIASSVYSDGVHDREYNRSNIQEFSRKPLPKVPALPPGYQNQMQTPR